MPDKLQAVLNDTLDISKQLILCLDRENACLIARKYEQLLDNAEKKQQLVSQLDALDRQMETFADPAAFDSMIKTTGDAQLSQLWAAIRSNIELCAEKNEVNGRLLQRQSQLTRDTMEILTGRSVSSETTYDASGRTSAQGSLLPNIEV